MSTIKISELQEITHLNTNTANTLIVGVDLPSGITGKITATTLAEGLYSFNPLNVGNNQILFPDTIGQFSGDSDAYLQVNLQNNNGDGSGDIVITANNGTDTTNYIDLGINGNTFSDSAYSAMSAIDGYLYTKGSTSKSSNLVIGTATTGSDIVLITGGTESANIFGRISGNYLRLNTNSSILFGDLTLQTTAASPAAFSQASFNKANTASGNTVYLLGALNTTNTNITSSNTQLKSYTDGLVSSSNTQLKSYTDGAIGSANTQLKSYTDGRFLANTNGNTFAGTLNISDKLNVNGSVIFANTQFTATQAALTIAACPIGDIQTPSNDGYMIHISGKQNVASRLVIDSFGANTYGLLAGRTARGTPTAPQAVANNDILLRLSGNGYGSTQFAPLGIARIDIVATETYTDATRGSRIEMWNVPNGSNTLNRIATFNGSSVEFTGVVNPQKGFIYNPNVVSGIVNSLTIDIANNSLYKFTCNATTTISLSGYQYGKVVEVWLKNVDNNNHTVTHGCQANNSTVGATSFSLTAGHSAYLRYFSIDGDNANTYVSVNYS